MYEDIRFWFANLLEVIGLTMIVGCMSLSLLPSTQRMVDERRKTCWKDLKNWSFPGTNDTAKSMAKLTRYERRVLLIWGLLIGGFVLANIGQAMGGA